MSSITHPAKEISSISTASTQNNAVDDNPDLDKTEEREITPLKGKDLELPRKRKHLSSEYCHEVGEPDSDGAKLARMSEACRTILKCIGEDPAREGLLKTPERWAKALLSMTSGYSLTPEKVLNGAVFSEDSHKEIVVVKDIDLHSMCEHHMLPFTGRVHVGYVPDGKSELTLYSLPESRPTTQLTRCNLHKIKKSSDCPKSRASPRCSPDVCRCKNASRGRSRTPWKRPCSPWGWAWCWNAVTSAW